MPKPLPKPSRLRYAIAAAERSEALGAHREAADQYASALRFADGLSDEERASLLERQSDSLYNTDEQAQAIDALEAAIALHRRAGNVLAEAVDLARIVPMLTCRGLFREAEEAAATALHLLEPLPPGPEHAAIYQAVARARFIEDDFAGAISWLRRALSLLDERNQPDLFVDISISAGTGEMLRDGPGGQRGPRGGSRSRSPARNSRSSRPRAPQPGDHCRRLPVV